MGEIRKDIITGNSVIIATERGKRPHDYTREVGVRQERKCPFCPGNEEETPPEVAALRSDTPPDTPGWSIRVVPNKFAAVNPDIELAQAKPGIYEYLPARGRAEVVIESPEHNKTLGVQPTEHIVNLLVLLQQRFINLATEKNIKFVQVFKNHGQIAGASLEHPHWQLISLPVIPVVLQEEYKGAEYYFESHQECIYCRIIQQEKQEVCRIIAENEHFLAFAPFASRFPLETWIIPLKHQNQFGNLTGAEIQELAILLKDISRVMEEDFNIPYNLLIHTAMPGNGNSHYHWHLEILPRLAITAGFELGTGIYINPTSPEIAASILKESLDNGK